MTYTVRKKGLTIVEIIISMGLYLMVTVMVFSFLLYSIRVSDKLNRIASGYAETNFALLKICSEVRDARSISVPSSGGGHILIISSTETDDKGITQDVNINYYLNIYQKRIYRMVNGTSNLLSENIEDISFINKDNLLIVKIVSSRYYDGKYFSAYSTVFPRLQV